MYIPHSISCHLAMFIHSFTYSSHIKTTCYVFTYPFAFTHHISSTHTHPLLSARIFHPPIHPFTHHICFAHTHTPSPASWNIVIRSSHIVPIYSLTLSCQLEHDHSHITYRVHIPTHPRLPAGIWSFTRHICHMLFSCQPAHPAPAVHPRNSPSRTPRRQNSGQTHAQMEFNELICVSMN